MDPIQNINNVAIHLQVNSSTSMTPTATMFLGDGKMTASIYDMEPKATVDTLLVSVKKTADIYQSTCCINYFCCKKPHLSSKLSKFFHSRYILPFMTANAVFYLIIAVIQTFIVVDPWCSISNLSYLLLELLRALMIITFLICVFLSSNEKLFYQQLKEFETLYKLFNCLKLLGFMEYHQYWTNVDQSDVSSVCVVVYMIKHFVYIVCISMVIIAVACIDSWPISSTSKAFSHILAFAGVLFYYYYFGTLRLYVYSIDIIRINIFGIFIIDTTVYEICRNALETLILFVFKQNLVFFYNEFNFCFLCNLCCFCISSNCMCNKTNTNTVAKLYACQFGGKRKNVALSITVHPTIHWKKYTYDVQHLLEISMQTFAKSPLIIHDDNSQHVQHVQQQQKQQQLDCSQYGKNNTCNDYNNYHNINQAKHNMTSNNYNIHSNSTINTNYNSLLIRQAQSNNDFYHLSLCNCYNYNCCLFCCKCTCCMSNGNLLQSNNYLSHIFHTGKGFIVLFICAFVYTILVCFQFIFYGNKESIGNQIFEITRSLVLISFILLVLLSFNVNLFKRQFVQFETIYKLYAVFKIAICEMFYLYLFKQDDNNIIYYHLEIFVNVLNFILLFLMIIGVSCIDAWNTRNYIKIISLIFALFGIFYYYFATISNRSSDDYFTFTIPIVNRLSNGLEAQKFAFLTLVIFLAKQMVLLIYFDFKLDCCNLANVFFKCVICPTICGRILAQSGYSPNKAVGITENPIIEWIED